jgi:lincosamide nucleotidyltransferase A/C/D/E
MTIGARDAVEVFDAFEDAGVVVWLDGGWGVDALLEAQTREHDDLDVVVDIDDLPRLIVVLAKRGFTTLKPWPDSPESFVLADPDDRRIDIHPLRFDDAGNGVQRIEKGEWTFPASGFLGTGIVGDRRVRCLTAEVQVLCHAGYELDDDDLRDMHALRERFGVELLPGQRRL